MELLVDPPTDLLCRSIWQFAFQGWNLPHWVHTCYAVLPPLSCLVILPASVIGSSFSTIYLQVLSADGHLFLDNCVSCGSQLQQAVLDLLPTCALVCCILSLFNCSEPLGLNNKLFTRFQLWLACSDTWLTGHLIPGDYCRTWQSVPTTPHMFGPDILQSILCFSLVS